MPISQENRVAKLTTTAFGDDILGLARFDISEAISELFQWRLEAVSEQKIPIKKVISEPCSILFKTYDTTRLFHGIAVDAQWVGIKGRYQAYHLVVRPWLWFLSRFTNCRIFSNKSVPDIIRAIFSERGFRSGHDFEFKLQTEYKPREYCVQYRETDLAFVCRLMEEEGIYFYFDHAEDKHTMIMVDASSSHSPCHNRSEIPWVPSVGNDWLGREHLHDWHSEERFRTPKFVLNDYDYKKPKTSLLVNTTTPAKYSKTDSEFYDHPGGYVERGEGERYTKIRVQAEQAHDNRRYASGEAITLYPGGQVNLTGHPEDDAKYLVVRAEHSYVTESYESTSDVSGASESYDGSYEFLPSEQQYRAPVVTPLPLVYGMHTALVVGPGGEEIHTDDYGRIRCQFYWDREKSESRWVRVAHLWAGAGWGTQFIPRIGMEVVVTYQEGNPDYPLVIGCVYNADNTHPYDVPGDKTQSGVKSNSSVGGGGYNELMFEDKKGHELIRKHAQKDYDVTVHHIESRTIGEDGVSGASRTATLLTGNDELTVATGKRTLTIAQSLDTTCGTSISEMAGASISETAGGSISETAGGSISEMAGGSISETAGGSVSVTAGGAITITAGASITLMAGGSTILINSAGVQILAPTFTVLAPGGILMKGAVVPLAL